MRIWLVIFILLLTQNLFAQKDWVSKINALKDMEKGSEKYAALLADICWEISEFSPDSAVYYCQLAQEYAEVLQNDSILTRALLGLSAVDSYKGKHAEALEKSFEALKIAEAEKDTLNMADAVNNIGIDLYYRGEFKEAAKYYKLFAEYSESIGNLKQYANALNNIAMIESELGNSKEEIRLYEDAIVIFTGIKDSMGISNTSINLGVAYANLSQHKKAISYFKGSYQYFKKYEFTSALAELLTFWAASLNELGLNKEALKKLRESIRIASDSDNRLQEFFAYELLHQVFYDLGQLDSAYFYQAKYHKLLQEDREKDKQQMVQELKLAYETEKKNQQIASLEQENRLRELESSRRRQYQIFLGVTSVLLIMAVGLLYSRNQIKSKVNKELAASNHTKDRLFSVISHDLKSPISSFNTITTNLTEHWDHVDKDQLKKYVDTLRDSSREVQDMMDNLMRWVLSQTGGLRCQKQNINLNHLLHDVTSQLNTAIHQKKLSIRNQLTGSEKVYADEGFLKIVLRNLVDNAIKFTPEGKSITIDYKTAGTSDFIEITDEGVGISAEIAPKLFDPDTLLDVQNSVRRGTGIGLKLCKELMDKMGGSVSVRSELGKGSTFILELTKP